MECWSVHVQTNTHFVFCLWLEKNLLFQFVNEDNEPEDLPLSQPAIVCDDLMRFVTQEPIFKPNDDGSVIGKFESFILGKYAPRRFGLNWSPFSERKHLYVLTELVSECECNRGQLIIHWVRAAHYSDVSKIQQFYQG